MERFAYYGYEDEEILSHLNNQEDMNSHEGSLTKAPKYKKNKIKTTKYNWLTFFPGSFLAQFKRKYNFYFLAVTLLQAIKPIQTVSFGLACLPLIFVFGVSMIRELIEEIRRGRQDKIVNNRETLVLREDKFHQVKWKNLCVGDIVMIHQEEYIPADIIIIRSSDHHGNAYIQTMALDGERALKQRQALNEIADEMKLNKVKIQDLKFYLKFGHPNNQIYQFDGDLYFKNPELSKMNVSMDQFMHRGSKLANTDWIIGIIAYAGHETKLMKSMIKSSTKISHAEREVNKVFLSILLVLQISLGLILGTGAIIVYQTKLEYSVSNGKIDGPWYLWKDEDDYNQNPLGYFIVLFFRHFLLFGWLLPILSLVTIEVIKIFQSLFIFLDAKMFSVYHNQGCKVFSISLGEELGVVNNIYTDKTGTLTANEMMLKACAIGTIKYDKNILEKEPEDASEENLKVLECIQNGLHEDNSSLENIKAYSQGSVRISKQKDFIHYFWMALSVCHEVISVSKRKQAIKKTHDDGVLIYHKDSSIIPKKRSTSKVDNSNLEEAHDKNKIKDESDEEEKGNESDNISEHDIDEDEELVYHGMSPDEITLVEAAKTIGYEFRYRSNNRIEIKINSEKKEFVLLQLFKFTSERKRMTIVIQDPDDKDAVIVITKGADDIMKELAEKEAISLDSDFAHDFSMLGYRTLMVGLKVISKSEYDKWESKFSNSKETEDTKMEYMDELEDGQIILGTTGLEDKLQENVHQCIEEFRRAQIKIWMITGDKLETAESVGISCRLLQDEGSRLFITSGENDQETVDNAQTILEKMRTGATINPNSQNSKAVCEESNGMHEEKKAENKGLMKSPRSPDHLQSKNDHSFLNGESHSNTIHGKNTPPKNMSFEDQTRELTLLEKKKYVENIVKYSGFNSILNKDSEKKEVAESMNKYELVIEGNTLNCLLQEEHKEILKEIITRCSSVIVCRATPKQKADILQFGKEIDPKQVSLAIGDGGNDVSMIKKADVGIGIYGKEGYQAVSASDFAIGEFQFLRRLLFVHGRNNHRRFRTFFIHMLTKNLIFCMGPFIFAFYNLFSGATYYEPTYAIIFNIMQMNLVIIIFAIYETDIDPDLKDKTESLMLPYLYNESRTLEMFKLWDFLKWYIYCGVMGVINFEINFWSFYHAVEADGKNFGQWQWSFTSYCAIMGIHLTIISQYVKTWNSCKIVSFILHVVLFFPVFVMLYHLFAESQIILYTHIKFWLNILVIVGACTFPFILFRRIHQLYFPYLIDIVIAKKFDEQEVHQKLKIREEE